MISENEFEGIKAHLVLRKEGTETLHNRSPLRPRPTLANAERDERPPRHKYAVDLS